MNASELRDILAGLMQKHGDLEVLMGMDDGVAPVVDVSHSPAFVDEYHGGKFSHPAIFVIEP